MIDANSLKAHGYQGPYPSHKGEGCVGAYQKVIRSKKDGLKAYFINFYIWDFNQINPGIDPQHRYSVSASVRFYADHGALSEPDGPTDFDLEPLIHKTTTIPQVEAFYAFAYKALNCVPDRHNNDSAPYVDPPEPGTRFERVG